MTIGERVAWYRRRRGLSQEVLAGLVGRTVDWLSKVENNRIELDRLSVIKAMADALDIALGDLLAEPSLLEWTSETGHRTVSALRDALLDYRQITMFGRSVGAVEPPTIDQLTRQVCELWDAYQASRFGYVTARLPELLTQAQAAVEVGPSTMEPHRLLGLTYQLAATQLTKIGEADLAWIAAERGLATARQTEDIAVIGSLTRSVVHALQSAGKYREAVRLTEDAAGMFASSLRTADGEILSIYGTLLLAGSMAAARADDRTATRSFIAEAYSAGRRLGRDGNHLWTAFGPTNVAVHRVATAAELGDIQFAVGLGPRIDTSAMPMERRVRHALEVARAYSRWNRNEEAQATLLDAEQMAPEQVRYHFLGRQLVTGWLRRGRAKPTPTLLALAKRMNMLQ
ncbi:helix-turn-helix domain-containing protein [Catellatospora bangladeshensis]